MIFLSKDAKPVSPIPGLIRKTLAQSESLMLCEFTFDANVEVPIHTHLHEQVGYVVEGHVKMIIDGKAYELSKGDSYCAPSNIPHGAFTIAPTVIVDTFYPPREDYK
jgi:unsaturated pyranuronate lyase